MKAIGVTCAAALLTGLTAGCSQKASSTAKTSSVDTSSQVEFSITLPNYVTNSEAVDTGSLKAALEKLANAKIDISWVPGTSYVDKFNVMMSSNSLTDAVVVTDLKNAAFLDAVEGDQFYNLDSYLKSSAYGDLAGLNSIALQNSKVNGHSYVVPRERAAKRQLVMYRKDWAQKAGLDAPDTLDKLYNMAKTFAKGDFDGNGKADTIGMMLGVSSDGGGSQINNLQELVVANGGYNIWGVNSKSEVQPYYTTDQYLKTMEWLNKMYGEGLISPDFSITQDDGSSLVTNYIDKEKSGIWLSAAVLPSLKDPLLLSKQKTNPSATRSDLYAYTFLKDSSGSDRIPAESGFAGGIAFSKAAIKDTARFQRILSVFNTIASKDGQVLLANGVEGVHYKLNSDGTAASLNSDLLSTELGSLNQIDLSWTKQYTTSVDALQDSLGKSQNTYKKSDLIDNASVPLNSDTWNSNSSKLNAIIDTAQIKYIMGQETLDKFKEDIQSWRTAGGDKVAKEYTDSYKKAKS